MRRPPAFRLGDPATCPRCGVLVPRHSGNQVFCCRKHALAAKNARKPPLTPEQKQKRAIYLAEYYSTHRAQQLAYYKRRYEMNKPELLAKQKEYLASIPPEELAARNRRYSAKYHSGRGKTEYQKRRLTYPWLNSLRGSKQRAKKEGIPFSLTRDWARERWNGNCEVTGLPFIFSTRRNPYLFSPSLDRIVPELGYAPDNC